MNVYCECGQELEVYAEENGIIKVFEHDCPEVSICVECKCEYHITKDKKKVCLNEACKRYGQGKDEL